MRRYRSRIIAVAIIIIAAALLKWWGVSPAVYLNASLVGLALAFVLQSLLQGLVCGLYLTLEAPFNTGETINCIGLSGIVLRRGIRTTTLLADSQRIIVPNLTLFSNPITVGVAPLPSTASITPERNQS